MVERVETERKFYPGQAVDRVVYSVTRKAEFKRQRTSVIRVTKAGYVYVSNGRGKFDADGREHMTRDERLSCLYHDRLEPITEP